MTRLHTLEESVAWLSKQTGQNWTWRDVLRALSGLQLETITVVIPPGIELFHLSDAGQWQAVYWSYHIKLEAAPNLEGFDQALFAEDLDSAKWLPMSLYGPDQEKRLRAMTAIPARYIRLSDPVLVQVREGPPPAPVSYFVENLQNMAHLVPDLASDIPASSDKFILPGAHPPIPGKRGGNAISRLAIKAAWIIQCKEGRKASVPQVMDLLGSWAEKGTEADTLLCRSGEDVIWLPNSVKNANGKVFNSEACRKVLRDWRNSCLRSDSQVTPENRDDMEDEEDKKSGQP